MASVHLVQFDIAWEDKNANQARVTELINATPTRAGDLIVLPELFDVGFTLNTGIAIDRDGSTLAFLQRLADTTNCTVHGSRALPSADPDLALNCATITRPGAPSPACEYAKIHPFSYGRESESYTGGDCVKLYDWDTDDRTLAICPCVCYDLRFPELFRLGAGLGATAFVYGANWPAPRTAHWRALSIARAIENQAFVFALNRTGSDPYLKYEGSSMVVDPQGAIIAELGDEQAVLSVEIDPTQVTRWRAAFPALNDMKLVSIPGAGQ